MPEDDVATEPAEEETPAKGKKAKKAKKPKKEKRPKEPAEAGSSPGFFRRQFPDVYSVLLVIALLAIVIAIAVLAVELSRYGYDIKASTAMIGSFLPDALRRAVFV